MATISDVAKIAGVSVATVSRVINNPQLVKAITKKRVEIAINKLEYKPNIIARNLRHEESRVILVLTPNITNPYYSHILSGIFAEARKQCYNAFISTVKTQEEYRDAMELIFSKHADGAILLAAENDFAWLEDVYENCPLVLCSEFPPSTDAVHISIDNYAAACEALEHLIGLGHKKIATVSSENKYNSTEERKRAYFDTMKKYNFDINYEYIYRASQDYSFQSGKQAMQHFLSLNQPPTAVFCISDMLALGCITKAQEMGYGVPKDISVVGFDDVENTKMFHPYITTVAQPCYDLGVKAAILLLSQFKGSITSRSLTLPHKLVVRESTGSPRR